MNSTFFPIFENMLSVNPEISTHESIDFPSEVLNRIVQIDFYLPPVNRNDPVDILLINDGQDLIAMDFDRVLRGMYASGAIRPLLCIGIHAGPLRKFEYGTSATADYKGRGNLARGYMSFITDELIPAIHHLFPEQPIASLSFAGFSLGGLSALDIVWNQPHRFQLAAVFSGSLWWRTKDMADPGYSDDQHRIMHNQIRNGNYLPGLKFFFECGTADETADRNGNGIIDSIDDTKDLMAALADKGYSPESDIFYHEIPGGTHDVTTWAAAMPVFLQWAYGLPGAMRKP